MTDEIMLTIGEDGKASLYDDTYDITIHCESQEEQDEVKRILQNVPHWIPVTERLPDEDQPVLVTDGAVMWVCSLIRTDDGYKWESNMGYWHDFDEWKAWKSLPEPYKGVTE